MRFNDVQFEIEGARREIYNLEKKKNKTKGEEKKLIDLKKEEANLVREKIKLMSLYEKD